MYRYHYQVRRHVQPYVRYWYLGTYVYVYWRGDLRSIDHSPCTVHGLFLRSIDNPMIPKHQNDGTAVPVPRLLGAAVQYEYGFDRDSFSTVLEFRTICAAVLDFLLYATKLQGKQIVSTGTSACPRHAMQQACKMVLESSAKTDNSCPTSCFAQNVALNIVCRTMCRLFLYVDLYVALC